MSYHVQYDYTAANAKELGLKRGEFVDVIDAPPKKQWWKVHVSEKDSIVVIFLFFPLGSELEWRDWIRACSVLETKGQETGACPPYSCIRQA
jgi:hypothetical protein